MVEGPEEWVNKTLKNSFLQPGLERFFGSPQTSMKEVARIREVIDDADQS